MIAWMPENTRILFNHKGVEDDRNDALYFNSGHISQCNISTENRKQLKLFFYTEIMRFVWVPRKVSPRRSQRGVVRYAVCARFLPRSVSLESELKRLVSPSHSKPIAHSNGHFEEEQVVTQHVPSTTRTHIEPPSPGQYVPLANGQTVSVSASRQVPRESASCICLNLDVVPTLHAPPCEPPTMKGPHVFACATITCCRTVCCFATTSSYRYVLPRLLLSRYAILPHVMLIGSCGGSRQIFFWEEGGRGRFF